MKTHLCALSTSLLCNCPASPNWSSKRMPNRSLLLFVSNFQLLTVHAVLSLCWTHIIVIKLDQPCPCFLGTNTKSNKKAKQGSKANLKTKKKPKEACLYTRGPSKRNWAHLSTTMVVPKSRAQAREVPFKLMRFKSFSQSTEPILAARCSGCSFKNQFLVCLYCLASFV